MLTPAFELSQDPESLTVAIRVPHARISEFDVYFEGVDFKFYARPYFLRRVPAVCARSLFRSPRSRFNPRFPDTLGGSLVPAWAESLPAASVDPVTEHGATHPVFVTLVLDPSRLVLFFRSMLAPATLTW